MKLIIIIIIIIVIVNTFINVMLLNIGVIEYRLIWYRSTVNG